MIYHSKFTTFTINPKIKAFSQEFFQTWYICLNIHINQSYLIKLFSALAPCRHIFLILRSLEGDVLFGLLSTLIFWLVLACRRLFRLYQVLGHFPEQQTDVSGLLRRHLHVADPIFLSKLFSLAFLYFTVQIGLVAHQENQSILPTCLPHKIMPFIDPI